MKTQKNGTLMLTQIAMLGAIIVLMALTPIGYLRIGPLSVTFLTVPVAIGAILLGITGGAILGLIFGLTSFFQCFGMDAFGTALLSINPIFAAIMCIVPRILIGVFSALTFEKCEKYSLNSTFSYALSAFVGAVTNTVFFVGFMILLFGNTEPVKALGNSVLKIIGVLVTTNSLAEAIICTLLVTAVSKACVKIMRKKK